MAAENLNDKLARNTNLLSGEIYKTTINRSVWNKLVPKGKWEAGLSSTQRALTVERNLPANIDAWGAVAPNSSSNNCAPIADVINRGSTDRSFSLTQKAIESDVICVNDGRDAYETKEQIKMVFENLRNAVAYAWKRRAQIDYFTLAENKVVAAEGLPFSATHMPTIAATSVLTSKILAKYYQFLIQNSAEIDGGSLGMADGRPQFILVTDSETSDSLKREDENFQAYLWNSKRVPDLLAALGVETSFRGFWHSIDNLPRRYTFASNTWTEVQPYVSTAATRGTKEVLNPAYIAAPYQDSYIFLPSVMSFLHPEPISTFGSGTTFDPKTYVGDFKWMNVINVDSTNPKYNPDGDLGFYRTKLMAATKPGSPQFGVVIRHLRCPADIGAQACPTPGTRDTLEGDEAFLV